ncbi:hypothetical protein [Citrifermentans bremense]|uniref:hypothetical protein n=1 Tax=Citrifermentans bremense TaxID=60035 RepID=UPI00047B2989|nr:hypothetical protein [Citrifermentans bremense]
MELRKIFIACSMMLGLFVVSGCAASFPGKDLSNLDYNKLTVVEPKRPLFISVSVYTRDDTINLGASAIFKEKLLRDLGASNLFESVSSGETNTGLQLKYNIKTDGTPAFVARLAGMVSGLTFGLIPVHVTDEYFMSVEVWDHGKLLKKYDYENSTGTWLSLFMAPFGEKANKVTDKIFDDMSIRAMSAISSDKLLVTSTK